MAEYEIKNGVGIIPEGTTNIVIGAFSECTELTSNKYRKLCFFFLYRIDSRNNTIFSY